MKNATSLYASYVKALLTCLLLFIILAANAQVNRRNTKSSVAYRANYQRISVSPSHTLEIRNGILWASGSNGNGQLGDGTQINRNSPVQIGTENTWVAIAAGSGHSLGLKANGTLWGWGSIVANGLNAFQLAPGQVGTENTWISIAAGNDASMALKSDGKLWTWGVNSSGQLGDSTYIDHYLPAQIGLSNNWESISMGDSHAAALSSSGELWTWGDNIYGELGNGTTINSNVPIHIGADSNWAVVCASLRNTMALRSNGSLWSWGDNIFGQIGDGTTVTRLSPVLVGTDHSWVSVSNGITSSFGLKCDGTLWAWGSNQNGRLGDGTAINRLAPIKIGTDKNWVNINTSGEHSFALKSNGSLWVWGENYYGQLGTGNNTDIYIPNMIRRDSFWLTLAASFQTSFGLKTDGTLWGWGANGFGQLGDGTLIEKSSPIQIGLDENWMSISPGRYHTLGLKSDGTLWAWGENSLGQLGNGTFISSNIPNKIGSDTTWASIYSGGLYSMALKSNGTLWAWGYNDFGQLGNGTIAIKSSPIQIGTDSTWTSISLGYNYTLALKSDGSLWGWGNNQNGQLGDGTTINRYFPTQIGFDNNWVIIYAAPTPWAGHSLALKSDGTLWAWGDNTYGQLGDGSYIDKHAPTQIGIENNWIYVASGIEFSLGLKSNGKLASWGNNGLGQFGDGTTQNQNVPSQFVVDSNWVSLKTGDGFSIGLKTIRSQYCASGDNQYGQLGNCNFTNQLNFVCNELPIQIISSPSNVSVCAGNSAVFTVSANSAVTYQWQEKYNGSWINLSNTGIYSGTNTPTLNLNGIPLFYNSRNYRCKLSSNSSCPPSVYTDSALLSVFIPTANISTSNGNISFCAGDSFLLTATGSGIVSSYQWFKGSNLLVGRTNDTLVINSGGSYYVTIVTNDNCSATSASVNINVINKPPAHITSIGNTNICAGKFVTLNGNSLAGVSRQWQLNGNDIPNAIFANHPADSSGIYTLKVTNGLGCDSTSNSLQVIVYPYPPASISYSGSPYTCTGTPLTLHANQGIGYTYQWRLNGSTILSANDSIYTASNADTALRYAVTVTNAGICSSTSAVTILNPIPQASSICLVTVDSLSQHNVIVWEKPQPPVTYLDSFRIYREDATNLYKYVTSVGYNQYSEITDTSSSANPQIKSARYKMAVVDVCHSVSPLSIWHNTVKLNDQQNGNFDWNEYKVENQTSTLVAAYLLQRYDSTAAAWITINTTAGTQTTMSAPNYSTHQNSLYRVVADLGVYSCTPSQRTQTGISVTRSNIKNRNAIGIKENSYDKYISLQPNPAKELVLVKNSIAIEKIVVYDYLGQVVLAQITDNSKTGSISINISQLAAGVYTVNCKGKNFEVRKKLVVE